MENKEIKVLSNNDNVSSTETLRQELPNSSEVLVEELEKHNKNKKDKLITILLAVVLLSIAGFMTYFWFNRPLGANVQTKYYLNDVEISSEDLVKDTTYVKITTDLDNGRSKTENVTILDRTAPEIIVDNGEYFNVRKSSLQYNGLTINDNYDNYEDLEIVIEGLDYEQEGEYNVNITAVDTSGNSHAISTIAKVVSDEYIVDGIVLQRDYSEYKTFNFRTNPSENVEFKNFETIYIKDVLEKLENKETFALMLGFADCPWCQDSQPILQKVLEDLDLTVYFVDTRDLDNLSNCEEACEVVIDIRKADDELYNEWAKTTEQEYVYVPYVITYIDGEKVDDFLTIDYNAHVRNINAQESEELTKIYTEMLTKIK